MGPIPKSRTSRKNKPPNICRVILDSRNNSYVMCGPDFWILSSNKWVCTVVGLLSAFSEQFKQAIFGGKRNRFRFTPIRHFPGRKTRVVFAPRLCPGFLDHRETKLTDLQVHQVEFAENVNIDALGLQKSG